MILEAGGDIRSFKASNPKFRRNARAFHIIMHIRDPNKFQRVARPVSRTDLLARVDMPTSCSIYETGKKRVM